MALPVVPIRRSAVLDGQTNGRLSPSILRGVPGLAGGAQVTLVVPAARSWVALADAAAKAGHILKASVPSSSYRTYVEQERIFLARYRREYKANTDVKVWNGVRWYRWYGATAAVPGTSNHGWAQAVDAGAERDGDAGAEPFDQATMNWLLAHADDYGWSWELEREPWHLHYFAGDSIPAAVLAYEAGQDPQPPHPQPPPEDDEMQPHWVTVDTKEKGAFVMPDGRVFDKLSDEEKGSFDAVFFSKAANQRQVDVVQNRVNN